MNKKYILRIVLIVAFLAIFLYTLPYLFRVYILMVPAIVVYLLLFRKDLFWNRNPEQSAPIEISDVDEKKSTWWNDLYFGILTTLRENKPLIRNTLLVIGSVFFLLVVSLYFIAGSLKRSRTYDELASIANEITIFRQHHKRLPENIEELIARNPLRNTWKEDYWGHPIMYTISSNSTSAQLRSAGEDGLLNTEDDLVVKTN